LPVIYNIEAIKKHFSQKYLYKLVEVKKKIQKYPRFTCLDLRKGNNKTLWFKKRD
jgi:hypothetical protein